MPDCPRIFKKDSVVTFYVLNDNFFSSQVACPYVLINTDTFSLFFFFSKILAYFSSLFLSFLIFFFSSKILIFFFVFYAYKNLFVFYQNIFCLILCSILLRFILFCLIPLPLILFPADLLHQNLKKFLIHRQHKHIFFFFLMAYLLSSKSNWRQQLLPDLKTESMRITDKHMNSELSLVSSLL